MKVRKYLVLYGAILFSLFIGGCQQEKKSLIQSQWLDAEGTVGVSISDSRYRLSSRYQNPTKEQLNIPVVITVHGFTATTKEWSEFVHQVDRDFNEDGQIYVSSVLLGGHGRDYETFNKSSWREWGEPILSEYKRLVEQGYKNISLAGSSTGGTLILNHLANNRFEPMPRNLFFIDSLVELGDKRFALVPYLYPFLSDRLNSKRMNDPVSYRNWYIVTPKKSLNELAYLVKETKGCLDKGVYLDKETLFGFFNPKMTLKLILSVYS